MGKARLNGCVAAAARELMGKRLFIRDWSSSFCLFEATISGEQAAEVIRNRDELRRMVESVEPSLVILDLFSKLFYTRTPSDVRPALQYTGDLAKEYCLAMQHVDHWAKSWRGLSLATTNTRQAITGATGKVDDPATVINLLPNGEAGTHWLLKWDKTRHRDLPEPIVLQRVPLEHGLAFAVALGVKPETGKTLSAGEATILAIVRDHGPLRHGDLMKHVESSGMLKPESAKKAIVRLHKTKKRIRLDDGLYSMQEIEDDSRPYKD